VVGALVWEGSWWWLTRVLGAPALDIYFLFHYTRRAEPYNEDTQILDRLVDDLQRVEEGGHGDDGGAVLVVVEDRDVELFLQPVLDLEAARGGDVLEVDAAEGRRHQFDRADDLLGVLGVEADREGVDAGELFEHH